MVVCRLIAVLLLVSGSLVAQKDRYVVFFKDKNGSPYSISQPDAFLSAKAIARRKHSFVSVTQEDLPVNVSYITQVRNAGPNVKTFFTSRWMNALLVEASSSDINLITSLPMVSRIELVARGAKLIGGRVKQQKQKNVGDAPGLSQAQLEMLELNDMHADNFRGEGVTVSIFDGGFRSANLITAFFPVFAENRVKITRDFVTNSGNVFQFDDHGTEVFSVIGAEIQNIFLGGAFRADFMLFVTEDVTSENRIEEYNWLFAAEKADSAGTDVIQSSLGYNTFDDPSMNYTKANLDGKTAVVSRAAAMARDRGIIVVTSAGNEGNTSWGLITAPADVDGILAAGAITSSGVKASFSSIGPTADGRIKPDVVALGQNTSVVLPSGTIGTASGTSFAAPLITSLVIGLLQAYPDLTPAQIVKAIKASADKGAHPDNKLGYGMPNYNSVKKYLETLKEEGFRIYPNPCDTLLTLEFTDVPNGTVDLSFYDVQGKLVSNTAGTVNALNNPIDISMANFAPGIYIIKIRTESRLLTGRFVKL